MLRQGTLPFKLEMSKDTTTPHAVPALFGEFAVGVGLVESVNRYMPKPRSRLHSRNSWKQGQRLHSLHRARYAGLQS